jgi:enoyl-[acyl-carrier protein] reductase I
MGDLLKGQNIIIMGVRNKWSIAWGIARAAYHEGAKLIFTYQGDREKDGVEELAASLGGVDTFQCDVSSDEELDVFFSAVKERYGVLHGLVHGVAHAKHEDIHNDFIYTSRDGFAHAMDVSAYSLIAVSRRAGALMSKGGSIITLTYMGSEKVFPGYNVMGVAKAALEATVRYLANDLGKSGIRVNAISAGAVKTISAKGVKDFSTILDATEEKAPLKKGVNQEELGDAAMFLLSSLSRGMTGEIMHVDCGYNIMGI